MTNTQERHRSPGVSREEELENLVSEFIDQFDQGYLQSLGDDPYPLDDLITRSRMALGEYGEEE